MTKLHGHLCLRRSRLPPAVTSRSAVTQRLHWSSAAELELELGVLSGVGGNDESRHVFVAVVSANTYF